MSGNVEAASKAATTKAKVKKAKKAYKKMLGKKNITWRDGDSKTYVEKGDYYKSFVTVGKKKAANILFALADIDNNKIPELIIFSKDADCFYEYDGQIYTFGGSMGCGDMENLYSIKKGYLYNRKTYYLDFGSSKDDKKFIKKLAGSTKLTKFKWYKNTAKNRKKVLK